VATRLALSARGLFAIVVITYGLAFLASRLWPMLQESLVGMTVGIPPFSVYVFEHFGVPGLTDPKNCDWMWCKPTTFGIVFTTGVWLGAAWLLCAGVARLLRPGRERSIVSSDPRPGVP
jgi:hypothetical protein